MGVGAYAYYRQVVENQKDALLSKIEVVAKMQGANEDTLRTLERAKNERQFLKAFQLVKDAIPSALLIQGHNPLLILHDVLSEGLHEGDDEFCLEQATAVRTLLVSLSERINAVLKDEAELKNALSKIMNRKKPT